MSPAKISAAGESSAGRSLREIDGAQGEGGGQVLRTSIALSAIFGYSIEISRIRANRSKPGLAAQHLEGVNLIRDICRGSANGNTIGSTTLKFLPSPVVAKGGKGSDERVDDANAFTARVRTAGAVTLLIQISLPYLLFSGMNRFELHLGGGTNVSMSPPIEHTNFVLLPLLLQMFPGMTTSVGLPARGYFPKGRGSLILRADGCDPDVATPLNLVRTVSESMSVLTQASRSAETWDICGKVYGSASEVDKNSVADKLSADLATKFQESQPHAHLNQCTVTVDTTPDGATSDEVSQKRKKQRHQDSIGVTLWACCRSGSSGDITAMLCSDVLCDFSRSDQLSFSSHTNAKLDTLVASMVFLLSSGCAVDEHTADQIVIYNALACARMKQRDGEDAVGRTFRVVVAPPSAISSKHLDTVVTLMRSSDEINRHCDVVLINAGDGSGNRVIDFRIV